MRDFTFEMYKKLCSEMKNSKYTPITVEQYCRGLEESQEKFIIMRHDVDRKPENALKLAQIEKDFNIKSTYYFRMHPKVFLPPIIQEISSMGHEIGYHYEVLDKAKGEPNRSIEIFESELSDFRKICIVKTICMHGNPNSIWNNKDLWNKFDFRDYGIVGEAYISIKFDDVAYFSDTGRDWSGKYSIKDHANNPLKYNIKSTDDLIGLIRKSQSVYFYINTHPERWNDGLISWSSQYVSQKLKNMIKLYILSKKYNVLRG